MMYNNLYRYEKTIRSILMRQFLMFLCLLPGVLWSQDAPTIIPNNNNTPKDTARQTDLIDIAKGLFHQPKKEREDRDKKVFFSFLPFGASVPGGSGRALITATTAAIYLGPRRTTNLSTAVFTPYLNFKGRFGANC